VVLPRCSFSPLHGGTAGQIADVLSQSLVTIWFSFLTARSEPARHRAFTARAGKDADRYWFQATGGAIAP